MFRRRWSALVPLAFGLALCTALVSTAGAASAVTIQNFAFAPQALTVPAGATITWTNQDTAPHTATSVDGAFDTDTLAKGQSATITLSKAGTFNYICSIHPFMKGTVIVTGAAQVAAPTPVVAAPQPAQPATATATSAPAALAAPAPAIAAPPMAPSRMPSRMPETGLGGSAATVGYAFALAALVTVAAAGLAFRAVRRTIGRG